MSNIVIKQLFFNKTNEIKFDLIYTYIYIYVYNTILLMVDVV